MLIDGVNIIMNQANSKVDNFTIKITFTASHVIVYYNYQ